MNSMQYDIYCPAARGQSEPHMLNFWLSSCLRRQRHIEQMLYGSLDQCERCDAGRVYFGLYVRHKTWEDLAACCRALLRRANRLDAGALSTGRLAGETK